MNMFPPHTNVLVVDDMKQMRAMVKGQAKLLGMKNIWEATNGREALAILEERRTIGNPIHLILSDWNMPVLTGIDFLAAVRNSPHYKDLPFVMITAEGEKQQVLQAIQRGVSNYITKPFTPAAFKSKLEIVWSKYAGKIPGLQSISSK
jgi:two-component system chemotaxis response regulator CheY